MRKLFPFLLLLLSLGASGQRYNDFTSKNPKAIRLMDMALKYYDARQQARSLELVTDALKEDSTFVEAYLLRANIYQDQQKPELAVEAYKHSIRFLPDFFPKTYLTMGKQMLLIGSYGEAKQAFEKYLTYPPENPILTGEAKQGLKSSIFAVNAIQNPVPFQPENMGDAINSADQEYLPAITADAGTFMFTRRYQTTNSRGQLSQEEDFYISTQSKEGWNKAIPMDDVNTSGNEGAPALSSDGRYLFLTACVERDGAYPGGKTGYGRCDIFLTRKDGSRWGDARNLEPPVNTSSWESQPSFSSDGRTLYFVRRMVDPQGHVDSDILMTRIGDDSKWSAPVSVSDKINTTGKELSVFIHPDDQTLYFSSDGHTGMGGLDIYLCRKQADGSWGDPVNLGYPINTKDDENSFLVAPSGKVAYFSSDRADSRGGLDIYQFDLYPAARPQLITYMKGKVMDAGTKEVLAANFELIDLSTGKIIIRSSSDRVTGEFLIALPAGKDYALNVSRKDYLFYSENFQLKVAASANEPFLKDVLMHPMKAGESMVLKNIFFATDSFLLKEESKIELDKLVSFLKANAGLKIEIGGHTDNVGDKKYNQGLSEKRAKSVLDYLLNAGIVSTRLSSKGYGDAKPVAANTTDSGRAQNRRTEFTVLSLN